MEICESGPHTCMVHAKNCKVLGLDIVDVGFVSDRESTSLHIVKALE